MSEFENVPLWEVWEMGVIHFLNDLVYLMNKDRHDEALYARKTKQ